MRLVTQMTPEELEEARKRAPYLYAAHRASSHRHLKEMADKEHNEDGKLCATTAAEKHRLDKEREDRILAGTEGEWTEDRMSKKLKSMQLSEQMLDDLWMVWCVVDDDKSNTVTCHELEVALGLFGHRINHLEILDMLREVKNLPS